MSNTRYWIAVIALILSVIGALNWGLVGLFRVDLVASLFGGAGEPASRLVYIVVGLAGLTLLVVTPLWSIDRERHATSRPIRT